MQREMLDALCAKAGIERVYHDQFGDRHEVDPETVEAIARDLGVLDHGEDVGAPETRSAIEPVTVLRAVGTPSILVHRPADAQDALAWEIEEESGGKHSGNPSFADLELVDTNQLGGRAFERRRLTLPVGLPPGYHRFTLRAGAETLAALLIVAPARAYLPPEVDEGPGIWGIAVQLYSLRGERDWGVGDFADLESFVRRAAAAGAGAVGLNPLHALYLDEPERASPYSPSSRLYLNALYIAVEAAPDFAESEEARALVRSAEFQAGLGRLRAAALVDYAGVARAKLRVLDILHASFRRRHLDTLSARGHDFRAFQESEGEALRRFSVFQALREARGRSDPPQRHWLNWPTPLRDPASPAVAQFAAENAERVEFFAYLQWIARAQLARCAAAAREAGMPVGLYRDLAVGVDAGAGEAWAAQDIVLGGWSVGVPPDSWNRKGQDWGLSPMNPLALRRQRYRAFIELIRDNMREAGALRIDHVAGLWRTFWIRHGQEPRHGAYVRYPFADLVAILALESQRARCAVIGEDLGTVPEGFRDELARAGILSYRLLYFERRHDGQCSRPQDYPRLALVAAGTHDLPPLPAYWSGADIETRAALGFFPELGQAEAERVRRRADCAGFANVLRDEGLIGEDAPDGVPVEAAYRFLARTPGRIVMVQIEDALGLVDQINVPSTVDEHPNWRRRLPLDVDAIFADSRVRSLSTALNRERPPRSGLRP